MSTDNPARRKLVAILAADVVGYSKKMGENEEQTLKNLKLCRVITDTSISKHHGRIFHTAGDSVIAEFASPVDAVVAAVEFQTNLKERNAVCDVGDRLEFRVGLNLGDVIIEGDNLYGAGINIAARIESIANPGSICVAHSVFSEVRKKLNNIRFTSRGAQALKNIEELIEVFDVSSDHLPARAPENSNGPIIEAGLNLKPVVLVGPIGIVGGNESTAILAAGLLDGIVTSLTKSSAVLVVKQSADPSKESSIPAEAQNQIRFKVTGSIQTAGSKLRIFITLENAASGTQMWSKRFDKTSDDIFEIQDEIVQKINQDIRHKIKEASFERIETIADASLSVPDLLDKAAGFFVRDGRNSSTKAERCLDLALELEPKSSMAMSMKAQCVDWHFDLSPYPVPEDAAINMLNMLDLAIKIDPRNYYALALKADQQCRSGAYKESIRTAEMALRIFPDFDQAKAITALSNFFLSGDVSHLESGKRLRYFFLPYVTLAWFSADLREKALDHAEQVFARLADIAYPGLCAAVVICSYLEDGASHPEVVRFLSKHPELNSNNCRRPIFGSHQANARFEAGLKKLFSLR